MATMSFPSTLRVINLTETSNNPKEYCGAMKSEHHVMANKIKKGQDQLIEFDLIQEEYTLEHLNPLDVKRFHNLEAYPLAFQTDKDVLSWACAMMIESSFGHNLIKAFEKSDWHICLSEVQNNGYYLDIEEKTLELDHFGLDVASIGRSSLFRNMILLNFAKALRDIWHEERIEEQNIDLLNTYKPEMAMMAERVRQADTDSVAVLIAYELRSAGFKELWRHILGTNDADMAQVLLNITDLYPTALYNGMALAHIFRQWYADAARVDACDHAFLEELDDILVEQTIALGTQALSEKDIEDMAQLPDQTSYLKDIAQTVLRDPYFCQLEDAINAAHLFQITYDLKVTMREGVPFRDSDLARKIFP